MIDYASTVVETAAGLISRPRYESQLHALLDTPVIKVLTGVRRCGKSSLLQLMREHIATTIPKAQIAHINLESPQGLVIESAAELLQAIERQAPDRSRRAYIFLDEVQLVPGWERAVNAIHSEWDCDIHVTGSNSQMLSGELSTHIAGRFIEVPVHTFSFEEFLRARGLDPRTPTSRAVREAWRDFLDIGGFPMLHLFPGAHAEQLSFVRSVYDSALLRDVIQHHHIRDVDVFNRIVQYCLANTGRTFSANSISKFLRGQGRRVSVDTVLNYLEYCTQAFILHRVTREEVPSKRLLAVEEKYFAADHGLRSALGFSNTTDIELALENIVFHELVSRGFSVNVGRVGSQEVDFVARRGAERLYVQVTYLLAGAEVVEREFGALRAIPDNFPKLVLSLDEAEMPRDGIAHRNLISWLLDTDTPANPHPDHSE